jgi:hypothetical protein
VRATNTSHNINSSWSNSNQVSTIVAPKAPTQLSPDGAVVDFTGDVTLSWQHNDGGDGADQSHYRIAWSDDNGSTWHDLDGGWNVKSSKSEHTIEAGTLDNGVDYVWRVRTEGVPSKGYGPWSSYVTMIGYTRPTVTIDAPADDEVITTLPVEVEWAYQQDEDLEQNAWQAQVWTAVDDGDGGWERDDLAHSQDGDDDAASTVFEALDNDAHYVVRVRAQDSQGDWSAWAEVVISADMLPPAGTTLDASYDVDSGTMMLHVVADSPVEGESADVLSFDVQRRVGAADDADWVTVVEDVDIDDETTVADMVPKLRGLNSYRLRVYSSAPSTATTDPVDAPVWPVDVQGWTFLSYGAAFDQVLRFRRSPTVSVTPDRRQQVVELAGRSDPVLLQGDQRSRKLKVSGTIRYAIPDDDGAYDPPPEEWYEAQEEAGVVCYRDPAGNRVFGMLSGMTVDPAGQDLELAAVEFTVTRVDYAERPLTVEVDEEEEGEEG